MQNKHIKLKSELHILRRQELKEKWIKQEYFSDNVIVYNRPRVLYIIPLYKIPNILIRANDMLMHESFPLLELLNKTFTLNYYK